jgi:lipid-A-disaccharide synthase
LRPLGLDPKRPTVALLPGSRVAEVKRLLPKMLGAARLLRAARPELTFVIPRAKTIPEGLIEGLIARSGLPDVRVLTEAYPDILTACDAGVVASGTATLDAALAELPMVAVYRVGWIASILAHLLVHVDRFSLPNLIADEKIIPELFGTDVDAKAIAAALGRFLDSPEETARVRAKLAAVRARLAGPGVYDRAATAVLGELDHELKPDMT